MMPLIKNLRLRCRRVSFWSVICLPLAAIAGLGWFHRNPQWKSKPTARQNQRASANASGGKVAVSHYEHGNNESGQIVPVAATSFSSTGGGEDADRSGDSEARFLAAIPGTWEDDYQGKRHLTVDRDGTGTMVVELDGIGKKLFAPRLSFDLEWNLSDGYIVMTTLGGEPKSKAELILKLYGNEARYKIIELNAERMLLLDGDGKTRYDWRRPGSAGAKTN